MWPIFFLIGGTCNHHPPPPPPLFDRWNERDESRVAPMQQRPHKPTCRRLPPSLVRQRCISSLLPTRCALSRHRRADNAVQYSKSNVWSGSTAVSFSAAFFGSPRRAFDDPLPYKRSTFDSGREPCHCCLLIRPNKRAVSLF